jgi:hypothetical protein
MKDEISVKELKKALNSDIETLLEKVAQAVNGAQPGRIIADSEEPVRDVSAQFREQLYQKALELRQRQDEPDFSPSPQFTENNVAQQGQADDKLSDDQRQS